MNGLVKNILESLVLIEMIIRWFGQYILFWAFLFEIMQKISIIYNNKNLMKQQYNLRKFSGL